MNTLSFETCSTLHGVRSGNKTMSESIEWAMSGMFYRVDIYDDLNNVTKRFIRSAEVDVAYN